MKNKITITYNKIKEEVINRQKKFGKGDPDICINKIFNGITFKYIVILLNYWPKCDESNEYAELEIEYDEKEEIPLTLMCLAANLLED